MKIIKEVFDTDFDPGRKMSDWEKYSVRRCSRGIVEKDGKIAIMHVTNLGFYKLPGGGIKFGETNEQGFVREVSEEVGASVKISSNPGAVIEWRDGFKLLQISYVYFSKVVGDINKNKLEEDEKADGFSLIWVDPAQALTLVSSGKRDDYESNFIIIRDAAILEEYLNTEKPKTNP